MKKYKTILVTLLCFTLAFSNAIDAKSKSKKIKLPSAGKIYVPKTFENISLQETEKFSQKEYGVAFTYSAKDTPLKLTYYIYPISENISLEFAMFAEYKNIVDGMMMVSEKDGGIFSLLQSEIIELNNQRVIHVLADIENDDSSYISELYFTYIRNQYIKLRATYPTTASKTFDLRSKSLSFFEHLLKQTQFKSKDKSKIIININADSINKDDEFNLKYSMIYGVVARGLLSKQLITTYPEYLDMNQKSLEILRSGTEKDKISLKSKTDELSLFDVQDAGFLRELIWQLFKRPYWQQPEDLDIQGFKEWTTKNESKKILARPDGVSVLFTR